MERVTFIVEATGATVSGLLNPETFEVRRRAGLAFQPEDAGRLAGRRLKDDPVLFTGGGVTELELSLLFDVELESTARALQDDVRAYTGPLVELAENGGDENTWARPPMVRFVWGKAWNVLGVVGCVAERLERFSPQGVPRRSWLRLRFRRVEDIPRPDPAGPPPPPHPVLEGLSERSSDTVPEPEPQEEQVIFRSGDRLDDVASRHYGDPRLWRWIAFVNDIEDPLRVPAGTTLRLPPPTVEENRP